MNRLFYTLSVLLISLSLSAQTNDEQSIISIIDTFFMGMKDGDTLSIKSTISHNCSLNSISSKPRTRDTEIRKESMDGFLKAISEKEPDVIYDERISSYDVKIDAAMAIAWTPYKFYLNETFSHCGVNVFSLVKFKDGWKITSIMDTRRKGDCL